MVKVVLANYGRNNFNNVVIPWAAGCQTIGICAYKECYSKSQKAVIGLTDLLARKNMMFLEMEENVENSFLYRNVWKYLSKFL